MVPTLFPARARGRVLRAGLVAALAFALGGCSSARPALPSKPQARHTMRLQGAAMIRDLAEPLPILVGWRRNLVGEALLKLLDGQSSVVVARSQTRVEVVERDPQTSQGGA